MNPGSKNWPWRSVMWSAAEENSARISGDWPMDLILSRSMTIPPFWKTRAEASMVIIVAL